MAIRQRIDGAQIRHSSLQIPTYMQGRDGSLKDQNGDPRPMKRRPRSATRNGRPAKAVRSSELDRNVGEEIIGSVWTIQAMVPGGDGMARLDDGRVGFASGVALGDRITVRAAEQHRGWLRATSWELAESSQHRVLPRCRWYERCGGCDWMHLSASEQVRAKASIVADALRRIAGIDTPLSDVRTGSAPFRYRRRVRFHIDSSGTLGLFARHSHDVVEIDDCLIAENRIVEELGLLRVGFRDRQQILAEFQSVEIRVSTHAPEVGLFWQQRSSQTSATALDAVMNLRDEHHVVGLAGEQERSLQSWVDFKNVEVRVPVGSFIQVNREVNGKLTAALCALCASYAVRSFVELYAGSGNLTLPLLACGLSGLAVELDPNAVRAAKLAAAGQGLAPETFVCADASRIDLGGFGGVDVALLDPPRAGAADAMGQIEALRPSFVAMCSCDPATLARDLKSLRQMGYHLSHLEAFDMFPQTHHVEVLVWLSRSTSTVPSEVLAR